MLPDVDPQDARGVTIADVSRLLAVPMPTLRSWELRYGMPALSRGGGRHRRYPPADVHALRLMRDEIARGQKAGVAARTVREVLGIGGPAGTLIHRLLADAERLDPAAIRARLDEAASTLGLADCVDDVLLPAMRQIGVWWKVGHCDVVQERMTTEAVRAWLDKRSAFAPAPNQAQPILLVCGPCDLHTIGLESLALLLRMQGRPCRVLGARISTTIAVTAVKATDAAAVVVVSHLATGRRRAIETIEALDRIGIPVFYAGNAFNTERGRLHVPGVYLGLRVQDACTQVEKMLAHKAFSAAG